MKLDTSSYYPKSTLDDEEEDPLAAGEEIPEPVEEEISEEEIEIDIAENPDCPHNHDMKDSPEYHAVTSVAQFISWILVPLLMPVYGIILIFNLSILDFAPFGTKTAFTLVVGAFNLAIPAIIVILLKRFGLVDDIGLNGRKERLIPYIITILCMGGTALFLHFKSFPMWAAMFFAGGAVAGLIELLVNFRWKISAHCAGIAGIVALLIQMNHDAMPQSGLMTWLIISIAAAGLLGSVRLWLNRHTLMQVLAGYAVGFCSVYFMMLIH